MTTYLEPTGFRYRAGELRAITVTGYGYCVATVKATGEEVRVKPSLGGWAEWATPEECIKIRARRRGER